MKAAKLRQSILQLAVQGKLVPQDLHDEPASELLARIRVEKAQFVKEGKIKKKNLYHLLWRMKFLMTCLMDGFGVGWGIYV